MIQGYEHRHRIIRVNPLRAKLTAFMVSSFFVSASQGRCFLRLGAVEIGEVFRDQKSFLGIFAVITWRAGNILALSRGAAFLVLLPVALSGGEWVAG
jgi:branched-chain amino acid transport system permease protein